MWPSLLALGTLAAAAAPISPPVRAAVAEALSVRGARAEVLDLTGALPPGCALARAESPGPISASGRVLLHLVGAGPGGGACGSWAWAQVRVIAPTLVTTRAVAEDAPLEGAVELVEREVAAGRRPLAELPSGARAARALPAGTPLQDASIRVGARPGETVAVLLRAGPLAVEQEGRAIACRRGRACALLPSGRRVEGAWHEGRIVLDPL